MDDKRLNPEVPMATLMLQAAVTLCLLQTRTYRTVGCKPPQPVAWTVAEGIHVAQYNRRLPLRRLLMQQHVGRQRMQSLLA